MNRKNILAAVLLLITVAACGGTGGGGETIAPEALHQRLQAKGEQPLVVDVREPHEYETVRIEGARLAPLGNVEQELANVPKDREIVLVCRTGNRSGIAQRRLAERGFTNLRNMDGGMVEWEERGLPVVKK